MLGLLSKIYGIAVGKRNTKYDRPGADLYKADVPVVSIGNLSTGGTGKTPFVRLVAEKLIGMGKRPAIIGRGYKKRMNGMLFVSDGAVLNYSAAECGDEMYMLAASIPVPVIAHELKFEAALKAQEIFDIDSIIIDDGFQHRMLHRDLDILLIDKETLINPELLPKGRLREPPESIRRADIVCCRSDMEKSLIEKVMQFAADIVFYSNKSIRPYRLDNTEVTSEDLIILKKGVIAVSGIAKPEGFISLLKNEGFSIVKHLAFGDHFRYKISTAEKIVEECLAHNLINVITTEKDAVKLKIFSEIFDKSNINVYVLPIIVGIDKGEYVLDSGLTKLFGSV